MFASSSIQVPMASSRQRPKKRLSLWDQHDRRLDNALFAANVPSFVLNHEQIILDWNPAFALIFAKAEGIRRGTHISAWFAHLDNFRRVPKRQERLYGEGILPIADRERATFVSPRYGRMVFTKIMNPMLDRASGRIIGWTVVLNINSVNKRQDFFEHLYAEIAAETRRMRHAAAFDNVVARTSWHKELRAAHVRASVGAQRVLELGAGSGSLTMDLLRLGKRVVAVDAETQLLRMLKDKTEGYGSQIKIVRQDIEALQNLPVARYDAATLFMLGDKVSDLSDLVARVAGALKPGAVLSLSGILGDMRMADLFADVHAWHMARDHFDTLKFQYQHVLEHEQQLESERLAKPSSTPRAISRETLRAALIENGFAIDEEQSDLWNGKVLFLKARKL